MRDSTNSNKKKTEIDDLAERVASVVNEKEKAYGSAFDKTGAFLKLLYPNGISDPEKFSDMLFTVRVFDKLMRVATGATNTTEGKVDAYSDIVGYGLLGLRKATAEKGGDGFVDLTPQKKDGPTPPPAKVTPNNSSRWAELAFGAPAHTPLRTFGFQKATSQPSDHGEAKQPPPPFVVGHIPHLPGLSKEQEQANPLVAKFAERIAAAVSDQEKLLEIAQSSKGTDVTQSRQTAPVAQDRAKVTVEELRALLEKFYFVEGTAHLPKVTADSTVSETEAVLLETAVDEAHRKQPEFPLKTAEDFESYHKAILGEVERMIGGRVPVSRRSVLFSAAQIERWREILAKEPSPELRAIIAKFIEGSEEAKDRSITKRLLDLFKMSAKNPQNQPDAYARRVSNGVSSPSTKDY